MAKNDGGPAFPNITPDMLVSGSPGMALRDWFAGMAIKDLLSGLSLEKMGVGEGWPEYYAGSAYRIADAMLAERSK